MLHAVRHDNKAHTLR